MDQESLLSAAGFVPDRLGFPNAWCGHLPFAAWLMARLRPACFVELGTHTGNSYLTFCQAAAAAGGTTRCFAVDTWRGDEHAGFYGEEVFKQLRAYHEPRYGGFSTLLRATFDAAVAHFDDRSIELLHIDGLHTYEAVAHDFATWLPKLAPGAIVLLHDTQVREGNFGVWKFWEELCARYPLHLEFKQSFGLGVLQIDTGPNPLEWLRTATPEQARVLDYFTALGLAMMERYRAQEQAAQTAHLTVQLAVQLAQRDAHIQKLEWSLAAWQRSFFGRLATVAYRCYELARLPVRAAHYVLNRRLMTKALDSIQRRWKNRRVLGMGTPVELPHLDWILQRLELSVTAPQVAARIGRWMTRRDIDNYRRNAERLCAFSENHGPAQVLRAMDLAVPDTKMAQRLRLLFVCGEFPNPIHGGGSRVADFIKVLSEQHDVYVAAWYDRRRDHDAYVELAPYCRALWGLSFEDLEGGCVNKLFDLIGGQPVDVVHYEWPRSLQSLEPRLGRFHLYTHMEAVSLSLWLDLKRLEPLSPEWCRRMVLLLNMLGVEVLDAARADMQIVVTDKDGQFLSRFCPGTPYYVVNHGINLDDFALPERPPEPATIVFTGNFTHYPNQDAVHFFMREIRPEILAAVPGLRVLLVGANPPADIKKYHDGRRIVVTGRVPDVRPFIQQAAVCIAPLISGAGLRTKVVQYAALRRASVVTPIAAEDFEFEAGRDLFIATDPHEFALRVVELLRNPARAVEMAQRAREKALTLYDNRRIAEIGLGNLYRQLQAGKGQL